MFDDRTMRRAPKIEALKTWPNALCTKVESQGYVVLSREFDQPRIIAEGKTAWSAWMNAEVMPRRNR